MTIDPRLFREVLGQYPTGVVVVTAMGAAGPVGMTVGSFGSASLDPPLVAFLPDKKSSSWKSLQEAGPGFCVNVLGAHQEDICRIVATRKEDKFVDIPWHGSAQGSPVIDDAVVYLHCVREAVYDAGDHDIVLGRVVDLGIQNATYPLLFFRGGYGSFKPSSLAAIEIGLIDHLRMVDLARPHMERLAERFSTEVTSSLLVGDELVLTASVGQTDARQVPTRVGIRIPFMAPAGGVFAAWGDHATRHRWFDALGTDVAAEIAEEFRGVPDRVRERGFSVTFGQDYLELESLFSRAVAGDPDVSQAGLRQRMLKLAAEYNPAELDLAAGRQLRVISAPVFSDDTGTVAFQLTIWGPRREIGDEEFMSYVTALKEEAEKASRSIAARR
jgi:flavin reductase (DIM6/NTAB) family NADH-FMN oxidoreductase RutF/DNA-binding IclR family transcriptional regulator